MRHIIHSLLASMLLLASCTTDTDLGIALAPFSEPFYASIECSTTRTYVGDEDKLLWSAGDRVTVFNGNTTPLEYQFAGDNGAESGAVNPVSSASVDSGNTLSANYAIYPHIASTTITGEGVINYTIPTTQIYAENSFGLGANVMVAVTENKEDKLLMFKNVCGYFEFSLYGEDVTVESIAFSGNNNEKLAGNATITATHDGTSSLAFADDATTTLTLDCGEGVELSENENNPTKFWFVVPAMTYEKGITITITDTDGNVMEKTTENRIVIERSTVQPLAVFDVDTYPPIPANQIWYTSTDGEVLTPYDENVFGANIISNVYENGKGIITFDGAVTSIGESAFRTLLRLQSITIPASVTSVGDNPFWLCYSLTSFDGKYASADNRCLIFDGELKSFAPSGLTSYTIPSGVTSIGNNAFSDCNSLTSITIPSSVTSIGSNPFLRCSSLASFDGKYASADNRCLIVDGELKSFASAGLTSYTIPSSVTSIGEDAFHWCGSLTNITLPSSVTSIGECAFRYCDSLVSISIPDGVTSIGESAFNRCSSMKAIYSKNTTPPLAGDYMFGYCHSELQIYVPISSVSAYKSAWSDYASKIEGYIF